MLSRSTPPKISRFESRPLRKSLCEGTFPQIPSGLAGTLRQKRTREPHGDNNVVQHLLAAPDASMSKLTVPMTSLLGSPTPLSQNMGSHTVLPSPPL